VVAAAGPADDLQVLGLVKRLEIIDRCDRHLLLVPHRQIGDGIDHSLEEPDREATAPFAERMVRAEVVLEEPLVPDVPPRR